MSEKTNIEWCDSTVNPTMGCDGCELWTGDRKWCYAGVMHDRYGGSSKGYAPTFDQVTLFPGRMAVAAKWKDLRGVERPDKPWIPKEFPRLVFISDMSDALSAAVPFDYLEREIIDVVSAWPHIGIWLTKRPERMAEFDAWLAAKGKAWPRNLWALTSVTNQATANLRIPHLIQVRATIRGISYEPALAPVDFSKWIGLTNAPVRNEEQMEALLRDRYFEKPEAWALHWIIFGGMSGNGRQEFHVSTGRKVVQQCAQKSVACFAKQMGSFVVDRNDAGYDGESPSEWPTGTDFDDNAIDPAVYQGKPVRVVLADKKGGDWSQWPADLRVRQFPRVEVAR